MYNLTYSIIAITPTKIHLFVNVTEPSLVGCGVWRIDETIDLSTLFNHKEAKWISRNQTEGVLLVEGDSLVIENLTPSTTYEIVCKSLSRSNQTLDTLAIKQMVITKPARFKISEAKQRGEYIVVRLDSNMDNTIRCLLFGDSSRHESHEVLVSESTVPFHIRSVHSGYKVHCTSFNNNTRKRII